MKDGDDDDDNDLADSNEIFILLLAVRTGPIKKNNEKYNRPIQSLSLSLSLRPPRDRFFRRIFRPINLIIAITV